MLGTSVVRIDTLPIRGLPYVCTYRFELPDSLVSAVP